MRTCTDFCSNRFVLSALVIGSITLAAPALGQERGVINEDLKLLASDGDSFDEFGWSIAMDLGVVAVGAHNDDDNGGNSGSAHVINAATGAQIVKLLPSDGAAGDQFGYSIAISDGIVAVGAYRDVESGTASGSAYLFDAVTGAQIAKLLPDDGAEQDFFGRSIAISNGIVAVGAPNDDDTGSNSGSVYLFNTATGIQTFKLIASDGEAGNSFGFSVAISNDVVAIGANFDNDSGFTSGSVYLFSATTGGQIHKLLASDGDAGDEFGFCVAIDNGIVAVGANRDDDNGPQSGSAYLFNASTGAQFAKLLPGNGVQVDQFGTSIAIDSGIVAVGAYRNDDSAFDSGSAYLFNASTGAQIAQLLASDGAANDYFGWSIAIDGGVVAVGAYVDDHIGANSGSAYAFTVPSVPCLADLTGDGILDFFDVQEFLGLFAAQDPAADFNSDGVFDFFDVQEFLNLYAAGCP
jgi:FG-GAP repeat